MLNDSLPVFKIFTGTTGGAGGSSTSFDLPDGWTKDNCWIAGFETLNPNGADEYLECDVCFGAGVITARLTNTKIYVYIAIAADSSFYNQPFKLVVGHIE